MFIDRRFLTSILMLVALIQIGCATYRLQGSTYMLFCILGQGCLVLDDADPEQVEVRILDSSLVELDSSDLGRMGVRFEGVGRFEIDTLQCLVSAQAWSCNGVDLDMSDGAVVLSPDGNFHSTPLLPLFAR